jgi:hypothetical protein
MLLPVTVLEGGNTKRTVVRAMYVREILSISIGCAQRVGMGTYDIHKPSDGVRKLPLPLWEGSSALQAVDENGHGVG